ncbi:MAG: hypothetical protein DRQ62_10270 [Gammaproteobacteria bacterium]|nr:MAG: hypothetical protein DRQ62_10270 [Gammaproteobacteria bacterium]
MLIFSKNHDELVRAQHNFDNEKLGAMLMEPYRDYPAHINLPNEITCHDVMMVLKGCTVKLEVTYNCDYIIHIVS